MQGLLNQVFQNEEELIPQSISEDPIVPPSSAVLMKVSSDLLYFDSRSPSPVRVPILPARSTSNINNISSRSPSPIRTPGILTTPNITAFSIDAGGGPSPAPDENAAGVGPPAAAEDNDPVSGSEEETLFQREVSQLVKSTETGERRSGSKYDEQAGAPGLSEGGLFCDCATPAAGIIGPALREQASFLKNDGRDERVSENVQGNTTSTSRPEPDVGCLGNCTPPAPGRFTTLLPKRGSRAKEPWAVNEGALKKANSNITVVELNNVAVGVGGNNPILDIDHLPKDVRINKSGLPILQNKLARGEYQAQQIKGADNSGQDTSSWRSKVPQCFLGCARAWGQLCGGNS